MKLPELREGIGRRMESERRLQTLYEERAVREDLMGRALADIPAEIDRLEAERTELYETERKYRETLLEGIWNLRGQGVPEEEIRKKIDLLKENVARTKQLDASVAPAKRVLSITRQLETDIAQIRMDAAVPFQSESGVQKALKTTDLFESAIDEFHAAYGQKWIVQNMRERIETSSWSGRDGHFKEILRRILYYIAYFTASPYQRSRMYSPGESVQRADGAQVELINLRAQVYRALKRIAWEREYLLEQLTHLEDQIRKA